MKKIVGSSTIMLIVISTIILQVFGFSLIDMISITESISDKLTSAMHFILSPFATSDNITENIFDKANMPPEVLNENYIDYTTLNADSGLYDSFAYFLSSYSNVDWTNSKLSEQIFCSKLLLVGIKRGVFDKEITYYTGVFCPYLRNNNYSNRGKTFNFLTSHIPYIFIISPDAYSYNIQGAYILWGSLFSEVKGKNTNNPFDIIVYIESIEITEYDAIDWSYFTQ